MSIVLLGLSHHGTPVEVLQKFSAKGEDVDSLGAQLKAEACLTEHVVLSTCNRVEIYGASEDPAFARTAILSALSRYSGLPEKDFESQVYFKEWEDAVRHLFEVSSGLDSVALGETEILGQIKDAYLREHASGCTGATLNTLFQKSLNVGKKVRTNTGIGRHKVSIASVAVDLASKIFMDLSRKNVLLVGSGEMARQAVLSLQSKGVSRIAIANRSPEGARKLSAEYGGRPVPYEELDSHAQWADILIASTSAPQAIITAERAQAWARRRSDSALFILDLGLPLNVAPDVADIDGIYVYNLDDLKSIADENLAERRKAVSDCEQLILRAAEHLMNRLEGRQRQLSGEDGRCQEGKALL